MTDLERLLERVEGATGPDREIDAALFCVKMGVPVDDHRAVARSPALPEYSADIDAIAALIELEFPKAGWSLYATGTPIHAERYWAKLPAIKLL